MTEYFECHVSNCFVTRDFDVVRIRNSVLEAFFVSHIQVTTNYFHSGSADRCEWMWMLHRIPIKRNSPVILLDSEACNITIGMGKHRFIGSYFPMSIRQRSSGLQLTNEELCQYRFSRSFSSCFRHEIHYSSIYSNIIHLLFVYNVALQYNYSTRKYECYMKLSYSNK